MTTIAVLVLAVDVQSNFWRSIVFPLLDILICPKQYAILSPSCTDCYDTHVYKSLQFLFSMLNDRYDYWCCTNSIPKGNDHFISLSCFAAIFEIGEHCKTVDAAFSLRLHWLHEWKIKFSTHSCSGETMNAEIEGGIETRRISPCFRIKFSGRVMKN